MQIYLHLAQMDRLNELWFNEEELLKDSVWTDNSRCEDSPILPWYSRMSRLLTGTSIQIPTPGARKGPPTLRARDWRRWLVLRPGDTLSQRQADFARGMKRASSRPNKKAAIKMKHSQTVDAATKTPVVPVDTAMAPTKGTSFVGLFQERVDSNRVVCLLKFLWPHSLITPCKSRCTADSLAILEAHLTSLSLSLSDTTLPESISEVMAIFYLLSPFCHAHPPVHIQAFI